MNRLDLSELDSEAGLGIVVLILFVALLVGFFVKAARFPKDGYGKTSTQVDAGR